MNNKVRKTVSFPEDLEIQIARRAQRFDRSFSAQVVADMRTILERSKRTNVLVVDPPPVSASGHYVPIEESDGKK